MILNDFNEQISKLNEAYRDYYTSNRAKVIWSVVNELPIEYFEKRIDRALWADHPPKLDWFQNVRNDYEKSLEYTNQDKFIHPKDLSRIDVHGMINGFRKQNR
jgi:hypothetical protein